MEKLHNIEGIEFEGQTMVLRVDGQVYRLPLAIASPRLADATAAARNHYRVSPSGYGIHWPELDEDLSIDGLIRLATNASYSPATEAIGALREGQDV